MPLTGMHGVTITVDCKTLDVSRVTSQNNAFEFWNNALSYGQLLYFLKLENHLFSFLSTG